MTPNKDLREEVARLIDPTAWEEYFLEDGRVDQEVASIFQDAYESSLDKADSILALIRQSDEGWRTVPVEPTEAMIVAGLDALGHWRKTLTPDEAILRRSSPMENGRQWMASATPEEKAAIRYRAMISAAPKPLGDV